MIKEYEKETVGFPLINIDNQRELLIENEKSLDQIIQPTYFLNLNKKHIPPNLFRGDVIASNKKENQRHLIFATDLQLQLLRKA